MDRANLLDRLEKLRNVILEERQAAKALVVDEMMALTDQKEQLLREMLPLVEDIDTLTDEEQAMAEAVHSENLRNAYFFWSALNWVRESVSFIGEKMRPESYGGSGSITREGYSGALISGRI